jgi:hypothetical protein
MTTLAYVILGIVVGALLVRAAWRVAKPDEALIISGFRTSQRPNGVGESMGFRIVTGRGCLVAPGITKVRRPSPRRMKARSRSRASCSRRFVLICAGGRLQDRRRLPVDRQRSAELSRSPRAGARSRVHLTDAFTRSDLRRRPTVWLRSARRGSPRSVGAPISVPTPLRVCIRPRGSDHR